MKQIKKGYYNSWILGAIIIVAIMVAGLVLKINWKFW